MFYYTEFRCCFFFCFYYYGVTIVKEALTSVFGTVSNDYEGYYSLDFRLGASVEDREGISVVVLHCQGIIHALIVVVINIMMSIPFSQDIRGQKERCCLQCKTVSPSRLDSTNGCPTVQLSTGLLNTF